MDSNKLMLVVGVAAVVAVAAVWIVLQDDDDGPEYDYDVTEVRKVVFDSGYTEYRAETDFSPELPKGVTLTATYKGIVLTEYTVTWPTDHLSLIIYPTESMSLDDIERNMVITFS